MSHTETKVWQSNFHQPVFTFCRAKIDDDKYVLHRFRKVTQLSLENCGRRFFIDKDVKNICENYANDYFLHCSVIIFEKY